MWSTSSLLSVLAVLPAVNCVAFGGPAPTAVGPDRALNGWTPKPTKGPSVSELRRRQTNDQPEMCGWIEGEISSYVTCSVGRTCMLYTTSSVGMAGCCEDSDFQNCGWASSCVDYSAYSASSCDRNCENDDFVRKCTNTNAPYCVTWRYDGNPGILDFGCGDDVFDTLQTIFQTGTGSSTTSKTLPIISNDAITFSEISSDVSETSDAETSTSDSDFSSTESADISTTETATATVTDDVTDETSLPVGGGGSRKTKSKKKSPVGAIAGGVVGGLVVIGLIIAAVVMLLMKKKKQQKEVANQQNVAAVQPPQPQTFNPAGQPGMVQQGMVQQVGAPVGVQQMPHSPGQQFQGYYAHDQKLNPQPQVNEYGHSPASNPVSPAPPYIQPYYANSPVAPPVPVQSPVPYQTREPTPGTHEVDAISAQPPQGQHPQQGYGGNVHEIGGGR